MRNREYNRFKRDLKAFGFSAAGNLPHIGPVIGYYDTYNKGRTLVKSGKRLVNSLKRKYL